MTLAPTQLHLSGPARLQPISNDPLPDIQRRAVETALRGLQEEKRLIDAEIVRSQLAIDGLHVRLKAKRDEIAKLKGMISPLKHFPNELISKIFVEYAVGSPRPPWLLGHVCSRWREVALTTPSLWSNIAVGLQSTSPTYSNFEKEKVLFSRGAKRLVSCTLILIRPSPSVFYLLPVFTEYANRIRHLSMDSIDAFLPILTLPAGTLNSLESLDLNFFPMREREIAPVSHAGEAPYNAITLFKDTPRLCRVSMNTGTYNRWMYPSILPLQLPWSQLTHLLFSPHLNIGYGVLSTVLRLCHHLVQCRFSIPEDDNSTLPTSLELQHLEALEITHWYFMITEFTGHASGLFLRHLLLPSLKRLVLTSQDGRGVLWPLDVIADLILRSACNIEVFHARSSLGNNPTLILLNIMPSITELLVQDISVLPVILGRMAHDEFLTNLRYIECRSYVVFESTHDEVIEALGDDGFMETPSDADDPLSVNIVTNGETSIGSLLDRFQRNWLRVSFQQLDGRLYEKDCEL